MAAWDKQARHRKVSLVPQVPLTQIVVPDTNALAKAVIREKIGHLRMAIYRRLLRDKITKEWRRVAVLVDFYVLVVQYLFSSLFELLTTTTTTTTTEEATIEIMALKTLSSKLGDKWWSRAHNAHEDCGNNLCRHNDEVVISPPLKVKYNMRTQELQISYLYQLKPSYIIDADESGDGMTIKEEDLSENNDDIDFSSCLHVNDVMDITENIKLE